jgi:anthranilate/para-aminobenzoate synthase component II
MILVIDNYDSFTYNLVQYIGSIDTEVNVIRNNEFEVDNIGKWQPSHIVISPGPGRPEDAGHSIDVIKNTETIFQYLEFVSDIKPLL